MCWIIQFQTRSRLYCNGFCQRSCIAERCARSQRYRDELRFVVYLALRFSLFYLQVERSNIRLWIFRCFLHTFTTMTTKRIIILISGIVTATGMCITFGQDSTLGTSGSFVATTAEKVILADNTDCLAGGVVAFFGGCPWGLRC